ncbi:MAG: tyrosine-type recombinase/integrase, partial [Candidatus Poribacteria bacterium]|nr:tyrosine-type recombinase/integrase [Candidatus Poribacteria bacterium]
MKGTRPLDNAEIRKVSEAFDGVFAVRNRSLFILGVSVGGRISELLALKVNDVWQNNKPVKDLLFDRNIVKGGEVSRAVPVNVDGREAIEALIAWHIELYGNADPTRPLFPSRKGQGLKTMTRIAAHNALKGAFEAAGLNGKLGTHSLRKSYAQRLYEQTNDIYAVQEMLGHKSVVTTQRYLGVNYASVRDASEAMSIHAEL